ncbi:GGDEF domain-containing protein [bacterium M00.F.Ca.ET.228.01.1.1]|uniref:GGDEF domain-containing protein n=1 Tax=Paraburkholderia phenoliruptrix TaxID=252970 RepID=UPI001091E05A|nr:GGDEF domain-containing protein [Paraburkholderia phenoliruptrix]TGP46235.1 GGDEF domain-containing protein [bacterium M00.F.Ca.ET.228.01.1.1]TGS03851.1 GGDEF domain-containing protein [bacterium M00.F.Ca.ET.191.01.1.1]TGU07529.1 GGDEF domain-containing protein [bacterium M00.F.Ca.ET.155.01.1.1]MBW0446358.1 GGDEF domain-containing protein [Paraburkholderia phenoliruptrix]MBW9096781.1 GGDEF domain-containing protein [Paraburkholderia phenoliruptrix]
MAAEASKTSTRIPEPLFAWRPGPLRVNGRPLTPGPATLAVASLLCLLIGLLYLALQIRTVFSDQVKQEYASLVLEAVEQAGTARARVGAWDQVPGAHDAAANGYRDARAELTRRLASLAALINASPAGGPRMPSSVLLPDATLAEMDALLSNASSYWHAQRDAHSADIRKRITLVSRMLIALAALLFCMLITALGMYARRNRLLAGQSHEFEHAALHDPMTGLANRRKLVAELQEAAMQASADASARKMAVLYVDLDGFKQVNDSLGHRVGDEFLIEVSKRFRESVRKDDLVARIGGDEFAVLVRQFSAQDELRHIAQRLIGCVAHTDKQMGMGMVRASIGIASYPDLVDDYRRLVAAADEAMYEVKRGGKDGYAFASRAAR